MKPTLNLQDYFLNQVRKDNVPLTVFLINGYQLKGVVKGHDNFTIVLMDADDRQQLVYKHAISTIQPYYPVVLTNNEME
ncbi:MAG: RNA chaperone Hfq [bacterium]|nr:RNA chaperone Hfq [bacterium]